MKGKRFNRVALLVALAGAVPAAGAAATLPAREGPLPIRDLLRGWTRATTPLPARQAAGSETASRLDALHALGGGRAPGRCATPLVLALHQSFARLNDPTRGLLARAARARVDGLAALHTSPDGEFRIHYSIDPGSADRVDPRDDDLDGVPDGVERLGVDLSDLLADIVHELDWPPAPSRAARPGGVDVILTALRGPSGGLETFVAPIAPPILAGPGAPVEPAEGSDAAIFLDAGYASTASSPRRVAAHALAHVVQMRESIRESVWWDEASATWMETRLAGDADRVAQEFAGSASSRARGLDGDLPAMTLEQFLWPHYLALSSGLDAAPIRKLWEEMAAVPGNNTIDAMDRTARRLIDSSLAEEVRIFHVWNLFLGRFDDGKHYPFGGRLATPTGEATFESFPARAASLPGPLPPLGSAMIRILGDGSQGGVRIRFAGDARGAWDLSALVHSAARPGQVRHVAVEVDASGEGYVPIPWRSLAAIDVLIQNLASPAMAPAEYHLAADYDPVLPFDLLSFTAEDAGDGAMLSWSTEAEERLAGWYVLRAAGPLGPFTKINPFLLPGAGLTGQPMSYLYVDSSVEPGRKYYYRIEGVTFEGFTESSHPAGVRVGGASPAGRSSN